MQFLRKLGDRLFSAKVVRVTRISDGKTVRPMTPAEEARFNSAFAKLDEAFEAMGYVLDKGGK